MPDPRPPEPRQPESVMPFGEHLEELRRRLIWMLVAPIPILIAALILGPRILLWVTRPLEHALRAAQQPVNYIATSPVEGFVLYLKVSFVATLLVAMPWILYQLWLFIRPGLYSHERRFAYFLMPMSVAMTGLAIAFLYWVLLPFSLYFLINFGATLIKQDVPRADPPPGIVLPHVPVLDGDPAEPTPGQMWINKPLEELRIRTDERTTRTLRLSGDSVIAQQYRLDEYITLVFWLAILFALVFQLPLVMLLLGWVDIVRPADLARHRRMVIFGCATVSAIFTPADPWSMLLMLGAMVALFEFGLLLMRYVPAKRILGPEDPRSRWDDGNEEA
ncbi:MAG: preprotein translocase subunit TatC [Phycisphaerales bacterium]|nr:preprotein translocase subunit TatC [Phycisphaerales bacterium]